MSWFEQIVASLIPGGSTIADAGTSLFAFFDTVTDGKMWRSLGWLLLGVVMMAGGLALWLKAEVM